MSFRLYEGQDHAKVYAQFRPIPPENLIDKILDFLREKYDGPMSLAADLGCGNGQCTLRLVDHFESVIGTDISQAQISEANGLCEQKNIKNVRFEASPAEQIPATDSSIQLITICEAAHWMDLPKVYEEAKRVLVDNGVFAIIGYVLPLYVPCEEEDKGKADAINLVIERVCEPVKRYYPVEAMQCLQEYPNVIIPFRDFTRDRGFVYKRKATVSDIVGCIQSYSPFVLFCNDKGDQVGRILIQDVADG